MKFSSNPPQPSTKDQYPSLDTVVTVDNCWYYLSLLEQFVQATQDMPNVILQQYLVRAEYRYFQWISKIDVVVQRYREPPVDVAFFWQAHMLSPLRFFEDHFRVNRQLVPYEQLNIPLKRIHEARINDRNAQIKWSQLMDKEPYHLTEDVVRKDLTGCATITCIICFVKMDVLWRDYTDWRMDHTIALQCHRCDGMFTVKHAGKTNFLLDLRDNRGSAGLLIEKSSKLKVKLSDATLIFPKDQVSALPFNQGLKPLENHMKMKQLVKATGDSEKKSANRKRVLDAIQSTYLCTPYRASSLDLIQAVARQYKFARKVTTEIQWDMPQGIINGIRQYSHFLALIKGNPDLTAVPTIAIDLAWHTHMLHPDHYHKFTMKCLGKFLNHDDTIPETHLQYHVENTDRAWKSFDKRAPIIQEEGLTSKFKKLLKRSTSTATTKKEKSCVLTQEEVAFKGYYQIGASPGDNGSTLEKSLFHDSNTSYHDKRDTEEFVELNNSHVIMDETFKDTQRSFLGFIGTSTCGNTDRLDRWEMPHTVTKKEALGIGKDKYTYKRVIRSTGIQPKITPSLLWSLPEANRAKYIPFQSFALQDTKEPRPNTAGNENFNWHEVSRAWGKANKTSNKKKGSSCAALLLVDNGASARSSSGGGTASNNGCDYRTSSCGSGSSSCSGGASSSCGGGSSSCGGGGSSSCGGGGSSSCGS